MHIITQKRIWEAKEKWPKAANALDAWYRLMKASAPKDFAAMKGIFPATDKVGPHHVFDIGGNKIRLIAIVHMVRGGFIFATFWTMANTTKANGRSDP